MTLDATLYWLATRQRARALLRDFGQPRTVSQIAKHLEVERDTCGYLLRTLLKQRLVRCLNPDARRSRVFHLSKKGRFVQRILRDREQLPPQKDAQEADWQLYGQLCYTQRSAVLRVLDHPMRSATIKRRARFRDRAIRMSTNNVRDVLRFFRASGIVRRVYQGRACYPHYELTEKGEELQRLLRGAETR